MYSQSLKIKIAANLAFILLLSILLTDFVIINIIENNLIQRKVEQGHLFLSMLAPHIQKDTEPGTISQDANIDRQFSSMFNESSLIYAFIRSINNTEYNFGLLPNNIDLNIEDTTTRTIKSGQPHSYLTGKTWGVFWRQKKYLLISDPIKLNDQLLGAGTIVYQLDEIYRTLRQSQKIIAFYVAANFLILLLFGVYRLSRLIIKPIRKFIKVTDEYGEKNQLYFTKGSKNHEFNQLSNALNRMVEKIENDKEKLHDSLKSLEKVNAHLKKAQHDIIKAEKLSSIGRLSAGIAHEIGNPIGIVLGYLDLLKSRPMLKHDDTGQDFIQRAEDEINRVNTIIRQLLDFSRVSPVPVDLCPISVTDLICDVVNVMSNQPMTSQIQIDYNLSATSNMVYADYDQLRQVLVNLIINAADSIMTSENKSKGVISITTEVFPAEHEMALNNQLTLALKVTDNGSGISENNIENIFDPFYTTKEPGKGTGLGLSVSYMIIEQMSGTISVESLIGNGTTMLICLPLYNLK